MDTLQFHYGNSCFSKLKKQNWWNPSISWKNKYKNNNPDEGSKFFGSTTIFVWTTDAWHFFQMIFLSTFFLGIVFYSPMFTFEYSWIIDFIIYRIIFGFIFSLSFKIL